MKFTRSVVFLMMMQGCAIAPPAIHVRVKDDATENGIPLTLSGLTNTIDGIEPTINFTWKF